jgi:phage shock protein C
MKKCPFCEESIQDEAIKCKHCKEFLNNNGDMHNSVKRLTRSSNDQFIAGVCGGLARYMNIDSSLVRILVVVIALMTGFLPVIIGYILMAIIVPEGN